MAAIEPVDRGTLADLMPDEVESFARLGDEGATFLGILAHVPGYAEALWGAMAEALFEGDVDHRLKEIIRLRLADTAEDPYFSSLRSEVARSEGLTDDRIAAARTSPEDEPFSDGERWALRYASLMYREPHRVDAAFYDEGKRHFREAQIMELGGLIAIHYGMQVFMRTLQPDA